MCRACNRLNYFAEIRRGAPGRTSEKEWLSITFDSTEGNVHTVHEGCFHEKEIFAIMEIAGDSVQMQVDTGASCNALLQRFVSPGTNIVESDLTLKMYSKFTMPVSRFRKISSEHAQPKEQQEIQ